MKRIMTLMLALLILVMPMANAQTAEEKPVLLGEFETTDINGETVNQDILINAPLTFVNVWGTFCGYCIDEMPDLAKLADEYKDQVQFIGIVADANYGEGLKDDIVKEAISMVEKTGTGNYTHIVPSDAMNEQLLFGIQSYPTSFFVDKDGRQVGMGYMGARDYDTWKSIIDETLAELEPAA